MTAGGDLEATDRTTVNINMFKLIILCLGQADKKVVILSQLREKLSFYRMFFLYLCTFNLMKKVEIIINWS
jgi:hypothetical protein